VTGILKLNPQVVSDLLEVAEYIALDNEEAAHHFLVAANEAFEQLAANPFLGAKRNFRNPRHSGIRAWTIPAFENYVAFYQPFDGGVYIVRLLHGARDIERLLDE
jgi:toxin ParE1/3/4